MKHAEGDSMTEYMSIFQNTLNQLKIAYIKLDHEFQLTVKNSLTQQREIALKSLTTRTLTKCLHFLN